ncbi:MAG: hypothetical protein V4631_23135 [Pseudomonadota bacterium]
MTFEAYEALREHGYALAGDLGDLKRRARMYQQMYRDSGKRSVFPLIAAHGALWALAYFKQGRLGAMILSLPYLLTPALRREKLASVAVFADRFREINRRVCAESYAIYHYTKRYGGSASIRSVIGDDFADTLCECHASNKADTDYPQALREKLFLAFFHWEQAHIVGPAVIEAFDDFDWDFVKYLAKRTRLDFTYFGKDFGVKFTNFSSVEERISRGLLVYHRAEEVGLDHAEDALSFYKHPDDTEHGFGRMGRIQLLINMK